MAKKLLLTLLAILIVAGLSQPIAASEDDAAIIFTAAETLYPKWFYPANLPVERYDGYEHLMYYRHYPDKNIYLLTYDGVVYYFYAGRYVRWFTANDWLAYLGSQQSLSPGEWLSVFCIAYLGRAPDPGSYQEWERLITSGELTLGQVVATIAHSREARNNAPYLDDPESATRDQIVSFVRNVYIYLQARFVPANDKDVASLVEELVRGRISSEEVIRHIVHVALGRGSSDWLTISHKIQASEYFRERFSDLERGWRTTDRTLARHALEQISSDPDSLVAARARIDQLLDESNVRKWEYEPTLDAITDEAGPDRDVNLGDPSVNRIQLELPAGAFAAETPVTLSHPTQSLVFDQARFAPLGVPLTLKINGSSQRLNEPAQVRIWFDPQTVREAGEVFIAYQHEEHGMFLQTPDQVDLNQGWVSFTTYHFSSYSSGQLDEAARIAEHVRRKSVEQHVRRNNPPEEQIGEMVRALMEDGLKVSDKTIVSIIARAVIEEVPYGKIGLAFYDLDGDAFTNASLSEIVKKLIKKRKELEDAGVGPSEIAALAKAAGHFMEGDHEGALKVLAEEIADNLPVIKHIKKVGEVAVKIVDHTIHDLWLAPELEKAYQVYKNGAQSRFVFFGYQVEPGNFEDVWTQMKGVAYKVTSDAIASHCNLRGISPCNLPQHVQDQIRENAKKRLEEQFLQRRAREAEIDLLQADNQKLIDLLQERGFLRREYGNPLYTGREELEDLLNKAFFLLDKIRYDTGRSELVSAVDWDIAKWKGEADHLLPREAIARLIREWFSSSEQERATIYLNSLIEMGLITPASERARVRITSGDITHILGPEETSATIRLVAEASPIGRYNYHWSFGDGRTFSGYKPPGEASGGNYTYRNLQDGSSFLVQVVLYSPRDEFLDVDTIRVTFLKEDPDNPADVSITPRSVNGPPGEYFFNLTAANLPDAVSAVKFTWDFGTGVDGSLYRARQGERTVSVNQGRAVHKIDQAYAEDGSYRLNVSAFDGDTGRPLGTATASVIIDGNPLTPCFFEPNYSQLGYHEIWNYANIVPYLMAYWWIDPGREGVPVTKHGPEYWYYDAAKSRPYSASCNKQGEPEGLFTWWDYHYDDGAYSRLNYIRQCSVRGRDGSLILFDGMCRESTPDGVVNQISNWSQGKKEGYFFQRHIKHETGSYVQGAEGYYSDNRPIGVWRFDVTNSRGSKGHCYKEMNGSTDWYHWNWQNSDCCTVCMMLKQDEDGDSWCIPVICE